MTRKFKVMVPRPKYNEDGVWWHRVGSAHENAKGQIFVYLDSNPIPGEDGQVKLMLFERDDDYQRNDARPKGSGTPDYGPDDEIPF